MDEIEDRLARMMHHALGERFASIDDLLDAVEAAVLTEQREAIYGR